MKYFFITSLISLCWIFLCDGAYHCEPVHEYELLTIEQQALRKKLEKVDSLKKDYRIYKEKINQIHQNAGQQVAFLKQEFDKLLTQLEKKQQESNLLWSQQWENAKQRFDESYEELKKIVQNIDSEKMQSEIEYSSSESKEDEEGFYILTNSKMKEFRKLLAAEMEKSEKCYVDEINELAAEYNKLNCKYRLLKYGLKGGLGGILLLILVGAWYYRFFNTTQIT